MKIDDLNIDIIKHLIDGRKAYKLIADDLNVAEKHDPCQGKKDA